MTLEEAIKHCEEVAERLENSCKRDWMCEDDERCSKEHRQLAEWLKALKEIWDSGSCNDCRNGQCEWKPKLGQLVRYNCPHYVGIANKAESEEEYG